MARPRRGEILRHSVLDRLVGASERHGDLRIGVEELRTSIRRDLEWLLNTRLVRGEVFAPYEEVAKSILAYGLPDLSVFSAASAADSATICDVITKAVRAFEPRFAKRSVKVEYLPSSEVTDLRMHFRITAMIEVDPITEPVVFDTAVQRDSGTVTVQEVE
jgi:type VI secretion system protein ImpF